MTAALLAPGAIGAPQGLGSTITVEKRGNGSGTVTSSPGGIDCGTFCSATFPAGVLVRLTATPAPGSIFYGWNSGSCVGAGSCTVGTTADATIQAIFYTVSDTDVEAAIVSTWFRQNGPPGARRVLRVRVAAEEPLARIVVRVRRSGVTLASLVVRGVERGTSIVRVPVRNAVAEGAAQVRVTFTSAAGARATQSRAIRIPALR